MPLPSPYVADVQKWHSLGPKVDYRGSSGLPDAIAWPPRGVCTRAIQQRNPGRLPFRLGRPVRRRLGWTCNGARLPAWGGIEGWGGDETLEDQFLWVDVIHRNHDPLRFLGQRSQYLVDLAIEVYDFGFELRDQ